MGGKIAVMLCSKSIKNIRLANYRLNAFQNKNKSFCIDNSNIKSSHISHSILIGNLVGILPAHAEAGKIFDFNATLPVMAGQFLLLMVFLDKTWFGPVGKILDERDAKIQTRLSSVKTGDEELELLAKEAETLLKAARSEAQNK